jgi:hypothetical protein
LYIKPQGSTFSSISTKPSKPHVKFKYRYNNRFLPFLWQFFLIPNTINVMFPSLLGSVLPEFDQYLVIYTFSTFQ